MIQVEPETLKWREARLPYLAALSQALRSGDFSQVAIDPLADSPQGDFGAPVTTQIEEKTVAGYLDKMTNAEQISLQQQSAVLESARRSRHAELSDRAMALKHAQDEADQYIRVDTAMTQEFAGVRKTNA